MVVITLASTKSRQGGGLDPFLSVPGWGLTKTFYSDFSFDSLSTNSAEN